MRLSSLKLAGFKSFADSSTLQFKANRTAVVGPNGCGKSNVIDAIRWVMGESSARQLRGGNMQDVIFTGTAKRKPVGVASVELRFDNTYGKLGGAYKAYRELAVRRQVTREGKSEYFLNGTRCRRRDITDIFLGTGLGPRSYSIIEQGMINRLVDAKPEDMRVFIEEAAGVSRYQARRRETLQHLEHTEQNLSRLQDISQELKSQLKSLKRQSEAAVQFKTLEQKIRSLKIEIWSFQANQAVALQQEYTVKMTELGETFKLVRSELSTIEHDLEATSALFQRLIQQSSPLQSEWQQAEKKLADLKMTLAQKQSLHAQNSTTVREQEQQKTQNKEKIQLAEIQLEHLNDQLEQQHQQLKNVEQQAQQYTENIEQLHKQQQSAQSFFAQIKTQVEQQQQRKQQMTLQLDQLHKNLGRLAQQKATLELQLSQIETQVNADELMTIQQDYEQTQARMYALNLKLRECDSELTDKKQVYSQIKAEIQRYKTDIEVLTAEQKNLTQWVAKKSPKQTDVIALMSALVLTETGKQHSERIEKLLSHWLNAHVLAEHTNFDAHTARQVKPRTLPVSKAMLGLAPISQWILSPQLSLWNTIWIAKNLEQAREVQQQLEQGQSIITEDGYHVGNDWIIALDYDEQSQSSGVLSHQIRLEEIAKDLIQQRAALEQLEQKLQVEQAQYQQYEQQQIQLQNNVKQATLQLQANEVKITKYQTAAQAFVLQREQLSTQLEQVNAQIEDDAMQRDDLEIDLHALDIKLESSLPQYQTEQTKLETLSEQLDEQQTQLKQLLQERNSTQQLVSQTQQQIELLEKDLSFFKNQHVLLIEQIEQAKKLIDPIQLELPSLESEFAQQLQQAEKLKNDWNMWQSELNQIQEKQQHLTEQRHQTQQQNDQVREQLEQYRLNWQTAKSSVENFQQQLQDLGAECISISELNLNDHQKLLASAQQQFDKMGAVNLAAAQEYEDVSKRFEELNHQVQDLENTVTQLKDAMKSIDQETKKLFMSTFDQVNAELQTLFPKVFNGGEASLSLEDDWQSGVKLMARPPGKRNSSLALLSGGEKALTALALVFAIFRLNPAPFCVLDEVDAPLDDANVQRFCNLVTELSEQVQFIYITHNKLAMTMATDLLGVTMPEPGTSKLVTVNLEEAKEYGLVTES